MKACVLYSGGKDSSLMATILKRLNLEVELVTVNFGVYRSWVPALESAKALGFPHSILRLDRSILDEAVEMIIDDGFPNNGINFVHRQALEATAGEYDIVADGTRRDDRTPKLTRDEIRSFEDRNSVEYINLTGFGYKTINRLASQLFILKREKSDIHNNSDYEIEIRYLIDKIRGMGESLRFFPEHYQTRVIGWK
ncbi:MAG TPA: hypothetical protein GXX31_03640 [Methanothermobacter sp.]|jgi:predicted subunit of tRNA(5-methylaminomethyl-2-thiouridylate) methyltransferase|uniref:Alpha hydrolase n=1 Tax=Methanothermobacter tenebrarum TaxID=680118 RepID=A0ABN6PCL2_9EURY|nr:hypothetical protein [Methanothermobacter tenebrarum]MDD3454383.1 hypothetical protein [Methanobacteriales archaeon]MDX9692875.1 hypothetical protein [Methanothermobacter sp.]BDH79987.1 hypothetical protein MTTB_13660 [Methanothermobacter tenebrarum]HHW16460.1 hypothetical protein [Methanothermobacter sp.]HOQ19782.1 hypothetical protein [Methanothermobacter sp.]